MAVKSIFILAKDKKYNYINHDDSVELNVRNCVAFIRRLSDDSSTHQISYHAHPDYEMHYILDGECEFEFENGNLYKVSKNQFIIIPPQKKHRIISESKIFSKIITEFEIKQLPQADNSFYRFFERKIRNVDIYDADNKIMFLVNELLENAINKKHEYKSLIASMLYAYFIETSRNVVGDIVIEKPAEIHDQRLKEAVNYIKSNILNNITLYDVSNSCFISTRQLTRIFKKHLDTTPSEYIRSLKIDYAERLLLETDMQISEIAEQLGFSEVTAFINFFRRYEDVTPTKFRKRSGWNRKSKI